MATSAARLGSPNRISMNKASKGLEPEKIAHLHGLLAFTLSIDRTFNASIERMLGLKKYKELMMS